MTEPTHEGQIRSVIQKSRAPRLNLWAVGLATFAAWLGSAHGQVATSTASTASPTAAQLELLRQQIKEELKLELRRELQEEIRAEQDQGEEAALVEDDFAEAAFWEEPVRPELLLFELDGYFRFRYDFFADLDLDTFYANPSVPFIQGPFAPGFAPPIPLCNTDVIDPSNPSGRTESCALGESDDNTIGGANIRLRLEPTLNVFEDIRIKTQIDILDNLVLGSTPDSLVSPYSPIAALSQTQISPSAGVSTVFQDSIRVKRVWAEYRTPLGELSFGRMPNHFGMGIMSNNGDGIDRDFGDTVDRLMFSTEIQGFVIAPAYDWVASGASSATLLAPQGQPFDRDQRDDVDQFVLTVTRIENPESRQLKLANGEVVFDFGTQQILRFQTLETLATSAPNTEVANQATTTQVIERDTSLYQWSYWAEFRYENLTLSAEYSGMFGKIGNAQLTGEYGDEPRRGIDLQQHGGVLKGQYKLLDNALSLEMMVVAASGDGAPGWGVFPLMPGSEGGDPRRGAWDGNQAPGNDDRITNFRFDPDFVVDLIFWRQLVGTVTDALIFRPSVQYELTEEFGGRLDFIYSRAFFGSSTPSGSFSDLDGQDDLGGTDENLGLEADLTLFFRSKHGFHAQFQYGIFIPMDGLDRELIVNEGDDADTRDNDLGPLRRQNATIAHTLQVLLGVSF